MKIKIAYRDCEKILQGIADNSFNHAFKYKNVFGKIAYLVYAVVAFVLIIGVVFVCIFPLSVLFFRDEVY